MSVRSRRGRTLASVVALAASLALASPVAAHAELVRAIPADGETVTEPVTVVGGTYSQDLAGDSRLEIKDAAGGTVATGAIDPNDARRMIARPDAPLTTGTYTVESTAISAEDGDLERATWTFTVAVPASPSATPEPSPTPSSESPSAAPSPSPTETPSASPAASPPPTTPTSGGGDALLPIIAALAVVAIGAGFLLSRSRRAGRPG